MTVVERTAGGYVKGVDKNGNTFYRDPNGHPAKQQSFAGSKGGQATAERYDTEVDLDPDTGKITGSRKRRKAPPPPPPAENMRVTGSMENETPTKGWGAGDILHFDLEISGIFEPGEVPSDDDIRRMIRAVAADQTEGNSDDFDDPDLDIEKVPTSAPATGWFDGNMTFDFEKGPTLDYEADPSQTRLGDFDE